MNHVKFNTYKKHYCVPIKTINNFCLNIPLSTKSKDNHGVKCKRLKNNPLPIYAVNQLEATPASYIVSFQDLDDCSISSDDIKTLNDIYKSKINNELKKLNIV